MTMIKGKKVKMIVMMTGI